MCEFGNEVWGDFLMSGMALAALIICTRLSVGASFAGWLLTGCALFLVTLECPGSDVNTVPAQSNWACQADLEALTWVTKLIQSRDNNVSQA